MGFDYEKVEKAWFKPKKTILDELEEDIRQRLTSFKIDKDYFIDERDLEDILYYIQELKKECR